MPDTKQVAGLETQWNTYDERVIPKTAGPTQRRELRRAYYAGAAAMLSTLDKISLAGDDDDVTGASIEDLSNELDAFLEQIKAGSA